MTRWCPRERALDSLNGTKVDWKLQITIGTELSKNGEGIKQGREWHPPVEAYPSDAHERASPSSATKRKDDKNKGGARGIIPGRETECRQR